jgi:hypothetical protein
MQRFVPGIKGREQHGQPETGDEGNTNGRNASRPATVALTIIPDGPEMINLVKISHLQSDVETESREDTITPRLLEPV